jgi:hypothetical protein
MADQKLCIWSHETLRQTKNFVFGLSELYGRPKTLYLVSRNFTADQKLCIWSLGTLRQTENFVFGLTELYGRPKILYLVSRNFTADQKFCIWSHGTLRQTENFVFGLAELHDSQKSHFISKNWKAELNTMIKHYNDLVARHQGRLLADKNGETEVWIYRISKFSEFTECSRLCLD